MKDREHYQGIRPVASHALGGRCCFGIAPDAIQAFKLRGQSMTLLLNATYEPSAGRAMAERPLPFFARGRLRSLNSMIVTFEEYRSVSSYPR